MNKESILYGIIGLLLGVIIGVFAAGRAVNSNNRSMMRMMGVDSSKLSANNTDDSMGMDAMVAGLQGKTGDEFDKLFLAEMILHHQGAIDMANLAKQSAKHDEIKKLADDIVVAQTKEISEMKTWQQQWGYPAEDGSMGGMHMMH